MKRIAIVGVGAIGGVVAALLQQANHEVILCTRRPLPELVVETPSGEILVEAENVVDPALAPRVDWVVVATKAYDVAGASQWLEHLRSPGTPLAVLQNGVEHRERFAPYLPLDMILPVVVDCPAERLSPGRIRQRGPMHLKVPDTESGSEFIRLFAGTSTNVATVPDFTTVAWRKLCHNAVGVLPTILLQPAGVLRGEAIGEVARQIIRECIAVGRAEGAVLSEEVVEEVLRAYRAAPPDSVNSLHADRLAGRPMEIDARNGVIVRFGEKHGIPTPNNRMAVALLEAMVPQA
jgi:2-dehydropantoate 2-reductase